MVVGQKKLYCSLGMTNIRRSEPVWKKVVIVTAGTSPGTDRQRHLEPGSLSLPDLLITAGAVATGPSEPPHTGAAASGSTQPL